MKRSVKEVEARAVTLTLPRPPLPLSQCFVNAGRTRIDSKAYTAWKLECDLHLMAFHAYALGGYQRPKMSGPVAVQFLIRPRRDNRRQDLDNCLKCLGDLLTRNYVIRDDADIMDLHIKWGQFDMAHDVVIEVEKAA